LTKTEEEETIIMSRSGRSITYPARNFVLTTAPAPYGLVRWPWQFHCTRVGYRLEMCRSAYERSQQIRKPLTRDRPRRHGRASIPATSAPPGSPVGACRNSPCSASSVVSRCAGGTGFL